MATQPFFHLRPNKCIDRSLFINTLIGLSSCFPISTYYYTGFGSYLFDDFKLMHNLLNISCLTSLERDPIEYERALYNLPYECIKVKNVESTEYLSSLKPNDAMHNIFWLDFEKPDELGSQIADYTSLLNLLNPNDIVRITLNANPGSLGNSQNPDELQKIRLECLKQRVKEEHLPHSLNSKDVTTKEYPITLLNILKSVAMQLLDDNPPYSPNYLLPLFSSVYADGQQMLTFTGIILDSHEKEDTIRKALAGYPHNNFEWASPCRIEIPALSVREIVELNKKLHSCDVRRQLIENFPFVFPPNNEQSVDSYIAYYKYYPNYHQVNF